VDRRTKEVSEEQFGAKRIGCVGQHAFARGRALPVGGQRSLPPIMK
jgi:hypothetical protein